MYRLFGDSSWIVKNVVAEVARLDSTPLRSSTVWCHRLLLWGTGKVREEVAPTWSRARFVHFVAR